MQDPKSPKHDALKDAQVCVLWHPCDRAPAPDLLRALANKGMTIVDADDPHTAFAAAQLASGRAQRTVLVLDQRQQLPDAERVIRALERFLPRVLCWAHAPGSNPPLVPLVQTVKKTGPAPQPAEPAPAPAPDAPAPATPLRLVASDNPPPGEPAPAPAPAPATKAHRPPLSARDVLDADELDALLAGELGDREP